MSQPTRPFRTLSIACHRRLLLQHHPRSRSRVQRPQPTQRFLDYSTCNSDHCHPTSWHPGVGSAVRGLHALNRPTASTTAPATTPTFRRCRRLPTPRDGRLFNAAVGDLHHLRPLSPTWVPCVTSRPNCSPPQYASVYSSVPGNSSYRPASTIDCPSCSATSDRPVDLQLVSTTKWTKDSTPPGRSSPR